MRSFTSLAGLVLCASLVCVAVPAAGDETYEEAVAAFQGGDYELAATKFQELIDSSPEWAPGYIVLGQCQYMLGQHDEAEQSIGKAAEIDAETDLYAAYMAPGQLLYKARRFAEAARPLARALEHAPATHHRSTALKLGYSHFLAREHDAARTVLEDCRQRYGFDPESGYYLAVACQRTGDYSCAIDNLARQLLRRPARPSMNSCFPSKMSRSSPHRPVSQMKWISCTPFARNTGRHLCTRRAQSFTLFRPPWAYKTMFPTPLRTARRSRSFASPSVE